jgi:light-regulated signal transduction histidine kinase (bacteriophytochrome)
MLELDDLVAVIAAPHEYARLWHYTQRLLEEGTPPIDYEFQGQRQDGTMIWVENVMRCVMWEGACSVQSTMVDITERKRAEEALARKTLDLQRSNDDLEQFVYVASDDLQEPLRVVSSYLYLLRDRCAGQLGVDAEQFIVLAVDGAERMQQLIRDLLAYARLGQQALALQSIAGNTVLDAALETLRFTLKDSGAKVTRERLPTVRVDPAQMELVWRHLIGNAIKFRGKKRPQVEIHSDFRGDAWLFSVRDNGIGIDPKDVERIFSLFQRLHPRDADAGTGIGLALCKRIVERHGGRIWVESQPGAGATFIFTLLA